MATTLARAMATVLAYHFRTSLHRRLVLKGRSHADVARSLQRVVAAAPPRGVTVSLFKLVRFENVTTPRRAEAVAGTRDFVARARAMDAYDLASQGAEDDADWEERKVVRIAAGSRATGVFAIHIVEQYRGPPRVALNYGADDLVLEFAATPMSARTSRHAWVIKADDDYFTRRGRLDARRRVVPTLRGEEEQLRRFVAAARWVRPVARILDRPWVDFGRGVDRSAVRCACPGPVFVVVGGEYRRARRCRIPAAVARVLARVRRGGR